MLRYRNEMPDEGMSMLAASASIPKHNYGSHLSLVTIFGPHDKVFYTVVYTYSVIFISTLTPIPSNANLIQKYVLYSLNLPWTTAMNKRVCTFH
jgi:hypothetical protein